MRPMKCAALFLLMLAVLVLCEGSSINDFVLGEPVMFELLEDAVSGARALKVQRRSARR